MATRITLQSGDRRWSTSVDGRRVSIEDGAGVFVVTTGPDDALFARMEGGHEAPGMAVRDGQRIWVSVGGQILDFTIADGRLPPETARRDHGALSAPMPATVLRVAVGPGAAVAEGDVLIVLEAMKMELSIRAPRDGIVTAVHCRAGEMVQPDVILIDLA